MKFQKGSKVEVMNKMELPTSWCVAEVVSGNKHTYNLRYDCYPGVEKVSRDIIRPCPPRSLDLHSWVAGDIVEVFDDNLWKTATMCNVFNGGRFSVRPHGFGHEINVNKSNIRARQSWQDGQWVPIVKISGSYGNVNASQMVEPNCHTKLASQIPLANAKTLKRASPFCSSHLKASPENPKKLKHSRRRLNPDLSFEKGDDAFACPEEASFYNIIENGFYELEKEKLNDSENDQCSVGSCSIFSDNPNKRSSSPYVANTRQENDIISSDAESFNNNTSCDEEEMEVEINIHRLELHAYRSTLEALYASGPLSWDKEALLTNLRINLHISNDEHLTELKNLISAGAGILD